MEEPLSVGLVGARGYVGRELIHLVQRHPRLRLAFASSRELAGQAIAGARPGEADHFRLLDPDAVAREAAELLVLALPNGLAAPYVSAAITARPAMYILDLSADHRFDEDWCYGLPERHREAIRQSRRISNPGCYATAMQLAAMPMLDWLDASAAPVFFGVSGYSGAGTKPSRKNDPEALRDNLIPYGLADHVHEREVSRQLQRAVRFLPHVAAYFRGLSVTAHLPLRPAAAARFPDEEAIRDAYDRHYAGEALVAVHSDAPEPRALAETPGAAVGGFALAPDRRSLAVVCALDNLLKGAASQAVQNINLMLGWRELEGIEENAS